VLPHVTRLSPEVLAKLSKYVAGGGKIVAVGSKPSLAPGFLDAARVSAEVRRASDALFASPNVQLVADDGAVGAALARAIAPDLRLSNNAADVGFVHRKLADGDIYFIANTSNHEVKASASFRSPRRHAAWWNPDNGQVTAAALASELTLAPYESRVLVMTDAPQAVTATPKLAPAGTLLDVSSDWQIRFPGVAAAPMPVLRSWTDDKATLHFSGEAIYTKTIELDGARLHGSRITLDFGPGTALASTPKVPAGMRAMFDSPVREAAVVFINGKRAGTVWHPPYVLDVGKLLQPGRNLIEVRVANSALNARAGQVPPDYGPLTAKYGQRFVPQDTALILPQPSGMLGPVRLMEEKIQ
jgi:hypothetical protein